jgi:hypothetical protein
MNLIKQFPDITEKMRSKIKVTQKNYKTAYAAQVIYVEDEAVVKFYEGEFRRWHFKLFFIVGSILAILYFGLLQSASVFNWVTG